MKFQKHIALFCGLRILTIRGGATRGKGRCFKMTITLLRAKIHRATVTDANLDYEGSIAIDKELIDAAGLARYELVHVVNINTGSRLETYVIEAPAESGTVCLNGAAARLGAKGDKVIILAYAQFSPEEARWFKPAIIHVDKNNKVVS